MSVKGTPKKQKENQIPSQEEEEYIRQLQKKKILLQQATNEKFKFILQNCYQMEEVSNDINVNLKGQTQKLENIHAVSNDMKKILKKADETSKQMVSFWYSIGKKIKRVFLKENDDDSQPSTKKQHQKIVNSEGLKQNNFVRCENKPQSTNLSQSPEDQYMEEISTQLRKLKYMARGTNQQLTKQHKLIDSVDKKTDQNSTKMNEINRRLVKKFF